MKALSEFVLGSLIVIAAGCSTPAQDDGRVTVCVSIAPQAFLVEEIAGDLVDVVVVVPPGADPHTYEPSPGTMRLVAESDAYLAIGMPFEDQWLPRIQGSTPGLMVARVDSGIARTSDQDPHIWMSPSLMRTIAQNTFLVLGRLEPDDAPSFEAGLERLEARIDSVDSAVRSILAGSEGASFVALHPAYAYFARDYGLNQIALEIEGSEPTPSELSLIVETVRGSGAEVIIVSPGFSTGSAEALSIELGFSTVQHDQLSRDWPASITGLAGIIAGGR